jgi:methylaspartate mutase epsilon subunit
MTGKVRDRKIEEGEFFKERQTVLSMWPTGKEVNLEEAIDYHKRLPEHKNFMKVAERLHREGRTVVFPRAGTPILEQEIELNQTLYESGLPLIPVTPDSYCRLLKFDKAKQGLEDSIRSGKPKLNGFPTVIHGVKNTRKVVESTEAALNQRMTNLDTRLMGEIAFAAGMTAGLQDPMIDFGCYEKNTTVEQIVRNSQYIYRLMGYYAERGAIITVDIDGMLPHGVFPLSVSVAGVVAVALLAARQGVKSIIPWSNMLGHIGQDIAWARLTRRLVREYLDRFGYKDTATPALFVAQVPIFPYPQDMGWSFGFLNYSAMVAAMAEAEGVYLRTIDEAAGIPVKEAHAVSYRSAKWIFDVVREQKMKFDFEEIRVEERIAEMEIRALLDKVFEVGDGDLAVGLQKAFDLGFMDTPFSSNIHMKGKVLGVRDMKGACRYLDFGNLPIPKEAREYHQEKIVERERLQGKKPDYHTVVEEFWSFSKAHLIETKGKVYTVPASGKRVMKKAHTVITGTVGQDSHSIGSRLLSRVLKDNGFKVVELGGLTPPEEFIHAARETDASAILVSSLYGMAEFDLAGFKEACVEAGLQDILLYLGGYLVVGRHDWAETESRFKALGFDRVYPPEIDLDKMIDDLMTDLSARGKTKN